LHCVVAFLARELIISSTLRPVLLDRGDTMPRPLDDDDDVDGDAEEGTTSDDEEEAPFEWLTSPASLDPSFQRIFADHDDDDHHRRTEGMMKVLHVGCGTSRLGEHLVDRWQVASVVNVDVDRDVLRRMRARWEKRQRTSRTTSSSPPPSQKNEPSPPPRMIFAEVDYSHEVIMDGAIADTKNDADCEELSAILGGPFDLIVDKSTMDCLLCTENSAAHLLQHIYNSLSSHGGTYLLVSFQHIALLRPLLEGLGTISTDHDNAGKAATGWEVQSIVMKRQVEDLGRKRETRNNDGTMDQQVDDDDAELSLDGTISPPEPSSSHTSTLPPWSSGSFHPDPKYHQFVNVFICRKHRDVGMLSRQNVIEHVTNVCNTYWTERNPILSPERIAHLQAAFGTTHDDNMTAVLSLPEAYEVLFTDAEREHLEYDHFLQDWHGFLSSSTTTTSTSLDRTTMTLDTALAFLKEVQ
jgi:hypothetical protein